MIKLEDEYTDIIKKAMIGTGISKKELCNLTNSNLDNVNQYLKGGNKDPVFKSFSELLNLNINALENHLKKKFIPPPIVANGLKQLNTKFKLSESESMFVNHFLINDLNNNAIIIDTGTDPDKTIKYIEDNQLSIKAIFVTHNHKDHILGLDKISKRFNSAHILTPPKVTYEKEYKYGLLSIYPYLTDGHSDDGTSYLVKGLEHSIIFVGDALFAHSQGGIYSSKKYKHAIKNNISKIFSLNENTIIAPGHGPLSTIKHEKKFNPFYANYFQK